MSLSTRRKGAPTLQKLDTDVQELYDKFKQGLNPGDFNNYYTLVTGEDWTDLIDTTFVTTTATTALTSELPLDDLGATGMAVNLTGAGNVTYNMTSTGDVLFQASGVTKVTIAQDGSLTTAGTLDVEGTFTIQDAGNDHDATIAVADLSANRAYTIPEATAAATFVLANAYTVTSGFVVYATGTAFTTGSPDTAGLVDKGSTQTISGDKVFTGSATVQGGSFALATSTFTWGPPGAGNAAVVNMTAQAGVGNTLTIPDSGGNAAFVMTAGAQTISGNKTFSGTVTSTGTLDIEGTLTLQDAGNDHDATIAVADLDAARAYTIPEAESDAEFYMSATNSGAIDMRRYTWLLVG